MILTCPECATRYEVDGANFPAGGRKVRCKKCGNVWHQPGEPQNVERAEIEETIFNPPAEPSVPEPEQKPTVEPEIGREPEWRAPESESDAQEEDDASKPRKVVAIGALTIAGWAGLVVAVLMIGWSVATFRTQIVSAWPKSASLFLGLGMTVNARGLDFADVHHTRQTEDGQPVLLITGKLVNVSSKKLDVPPLRVTLSDENSRPLYEWSFEPSNSPLAPGQSVRFRTRLSNPPSAARHVDIRFADGSE